MRPIIINQNNVVNNGFNDTYIYRFPNGSVEFRDDTVAIASIAMYYSWFNITSATTQSRYNNNIFEYIWYDAGGPTTYTVTIPDGYYEISDINEYLQFQMIANGTYLVDGSGNNVYYLEIVTNAQYYGVQVNAYPIPTGLPAGWSNPAGLTFPAVASTPQLVVLSTNNFGLVIGFDAGTYPTVTQNTDYSVLSTFTPQITPVNSLILSCTLLNNKYSIPSTLLYSFAPSGTQFGGLLLIQPSQYSFVDVQDGAYTDFTIQFFDQNLNRIYINDSNVVINMVIAHKESYLLK